MIDWTGETRRVADDSPGPPSTIAGRAGATANLRAARGGCRVAERLLKAKRRTPPQESSIITRALVFFALVFTFESNHALPTHKSPLAPDGHCAMPMLQEYATLIQAHERFSQVVAAKKNTGANAEILRAHAEFAKVVNKFRASYGEFTCVFETPEQKFTVDPRDHYAVVDEVADAPPADAKTSECAPAFRSEYLAWQTEARPHVESMLAVADHLAEKKEAVDTMLAGARQIAVLGEKFRSKHAEAFRCVIPWNGGGRQLVDASAVDRDIQRNYDIIRKLERI